MKIVPIFTIEGEERMQILVNSFIWNFYSIWMSDCRIVVCKGGRKKEGSKQSANFADIQIPIEVII